MPTAQKYSIGKFREKGQTLRMLFLWKGSIYRMVWNEILLWLVLYYSLNMIYRFALDDSQRRLFEQIVTDVESGIRFIPVSFVLGFYVSIIVSRYWAIWENLPRPDGIALKISSIIRGIESRDRITRRTCMRYIILAIILTYRKVSWPVKKVYPDMDSIIKKGLLNKEEKELLLQAGGDSTPPFWMPLSWVGTILYKARQENRIKDDPALGYLLSDLAKFKNSCNKTLQVDLIGIPLAYSQVVILTLYTFWIGSIICRQTVYNSDVSKESYFPLFTLLQLVVFIGWLCVAESMIHPFGEDDDDFQLDWMIDRHIQSTYRMIDSVDDKNQPMLSVDEKWNQLREEALAVSKSQPSTPVHGPAPTSKLKNYQIFDFDSKRAAEYKDVMSRKSPPSSAWKTHEATIGAKDPASARYNAW